MFFFFFNIQLFFIVYRKNLGPGESTEVAVQASWPATIADPPLGKIFHISLLAYVEGTSRNPTNQKSAGKPLASNLADIAVTVLQKSAVVHY